MRRSRGLGDVYKRQILFDLTSVNNGSSPLSVKKETKMLKYKVGDVLVVVGNQSGHDFDIGELVEITNLFDDNYYAKDAGGDWWAVIDEDLSPTAAAEPDMVNSPAHYGTGMIECIEYIQDFLTTEEFIGYLRGNIAKYLHRFRYKNGIEDLKKATWYLDRLTAVMEDISDVQNSK
jgi:hypothetical protein